MRFSSPKDALLHYGKIQAITRGRISSANHEFLAEKVAAGDVIEGYESAVVIKDTGVVFKNVEAPVSNEKVIADFSLRFPVDTPVHAYLDGKRLNVSMREVCGNCRVSLVQCTCGVPEIVRPDGRGSM